MLEEMPATAFNEWMQYSEVEPFGHPWENWLMAVNAWQFACAHSDPKKEKPKFESYFYESKQDKEARKAAETKEFFMLLDSKAKNG